MTPSIGIRFRDTEPLTDVELEQLAFEGDEAALDHIMQHTYCEPDPECQHCFHKRWLAHLDPFDRYDLRT
jgi:hypothetical protein